MSSAQPSLITFLTFPNDLVKTCFIAITVLLISPAHYLAAQNTGNPDLLFREAERLFIDNNHNQNLSEQLFLSYYRDHCSTPVHHEKCAEAEIYLGSISRTGGEYDQATEFYNLAESRITDSPENNSSLLVRIYTQHFYLDDEQENISMAETWVERALKLVNEKELNGVPAARAYLANGSLQITLGNYQDAIDVFQIALDLIHTDPESDSRTAKRLLSQGYTNMGIAYGRLGMYDEALQQYEYARQIILDTFGSEDREMALIYNSLGSISYFSGDYGTAAQYFLRTGSILSEIHGEIHEGVAIAYNNAGSTYMSLGDVVSATEYLEKAQQIKESLYGFENFDIAVGYNNLAYLYVQNEQYEKAEEYYRLSIEIRERLYDSMHPTLTAPLLQLSSMYIQTNNYSGARALLRRVIGIAEERLGTVHPDAIEAMMLISNSYLVQGSLEDAEQGYASLIELLLTENTLAREESFSTVQPETIRYPVKLVESIRGYTATLYNKYLNNPQEEILARILDAAGLASNTIAFLQTAYQSEASKLNLLDKNHDIYATALDAIYELYAMTGDSNRIDQMVYYSEKSRSRIALEYLQTVEARNFGGVPQEVVDNELKLNQRVTELILKLNLEKEKVNESSDSLLVVSLTDSLFNARQNLREFTTLLESNYPSYFELKYDQRVAGADDIQSFISEDETVILYSFGRNNLYAVILEKDKKSLHKLTLDDNINSRISDLRNALETANREEYRKHANHLYEQLIAPIRPAVNSESLTLLPDQVLQYLPFELLLTENSESTIPDYRLPFMIRDFEIRYSPSATVLLSEKSPDDEEVPQNLLAIAPFEQEGISYSTHTGISRGQNRLGALPLTGYEAREIASLFRQRDTVWNFFFPEQAEVLTGRRASRNRVLNGVMDDYGFIHFATHAFIHETNPSLSGIALHSGDNESGMIYMSDIYNLSMNADLVVLGACETGLGELHRGEGLIGFTRAFFFAGASNLVVSMWKVDDQSTANLMVSFYRNIRNEEMEYAAALRKAKLELANHPEYAFPSNWAAFILNVRQ